MNTCKICERTIPDEATHCSAGCLAKARFEGIEEIVNARTSFTEAMDKMLKMEVEPVVLPELATVVVHHRGKRGRIEVVGDTIFRFNEAGDARMSYVGCAINDIEALIKASKGLASYRIEQPISLEVEPAKEETKAVAQIVAEPAPVVEIEQEEEIEEGIVDAVPVKKKHPPKR